MNLEITGKLVVKYEPQEFGEKKFKTREFVIELAEEISGNIYTNYAKMQLVQAKCDIIDKFNIGDMVKASFNVRGRSYVDKKDGSTKYISNLDVWRVEGASATANNNQNNNQNNNNQYNNNQGNNYQPQQQAPAYNNNGGGYNNNNNNGGNNNYNAAPNNYNPSPESVDDLPF